jgi:hypothetical protein
VKDDEGRERRHTGGAAVAAVSGAMAGPPKAAAASGAPARQTSQTKGQKVKATQESNETSGQCQIEESRKFDTF